MSNTDAISLTAWQERSSRIMDEVKDSAAFRMMDTDDPWSEVSLNAIERSMLDSWEIAADIPPNLTEQYEAFLGEGLARRFGGEWVILSPEMVGNTSETAAPGLGIAYSGFDGVDVVSSLVPFAYRVGTGTWWSSSFNVTTQLSQR